MKVEGTCASRAVLFLSAATLSRPRGREKISNDTGITTRDSDVVRMESTGGEDDNDEDTPLLETIDAVVADAIAASLGAPSDEKKCFATSLLVDKGPCDNVFTLILLTLVVELVLPPAPPPPPLPALAGEKEELDIGGGSHDTASIETRLRTKFDLVI
jgi:hypothetical protein